MLRWFFCFFEEVGNPLLEVKWIRIEVKGFTGEGVATFFKALYKLVSDLVKFL